MSDPQSVAYWNAPAEDPNFVSRPPDPGPVNFYKALGADALYHSPVSAISRLFNSREAQAGMDKQFDANGVRPTPTMLDPKTANEKYGMGGQLKFDEPISESAAQLLAARKQQSNDRDYLIQSGQTTGFRKVSGVGMGMAASILDPINLASMFVPVIGEENIARLAGMVRSKVGQRMIQGGLTGASAQATLEPLIMYSNLKDQENYTLMDSAKNLGFGLAFGGLIHAGLGAVADRISSLKPAEKAQIFETAMNDVLNDRPVQNPAKVADFAPEETVKSPAVKYNGEIYEGEHHAAIGEQIKEIDPDYSQDKGEVGFTTSQDRFLNREDAYKLARESGQVQQSHLEGVMDPNTGENIAPPMGARDLHAPDTFPTDRLTTKELQLSSIPKRDPETGKFLSNEQRLKMLDDQVRSQQVENDRVKKVNEMTKTESPRDTEVTPNELRDVPKDEAEVRQQVEDLKKQVGLEKEESAALDEKIKQEVGDQKGREDGVKAAVDCITKHLI